MDNQSERELRRHVRVLCTRIGPRMVGTPGDAAAASYVQSHFEQLGMKVAGNTMSCMGWDLLSTTFRVDGRSYPAIGNMYSPAGTAKAPLVLCEPDIPGRAYRDLKGKAVVVYGDYNPPPSRLNAFAVGAEKAGAACVVAIDFDQTTASTKLIRELGLKRMPVLSVSREVGYRLARLEGCMAECAVRSRRYRSSTRDVIGIFHGGKREISIEAHRDTAPDTPGADDNGSGTVVLLELARLLAGSKLRHTVRFVSATLEEFADSGVPHYARTFAAEIRRTDLAINADCVGGVLCPVSVHVKKGDPIAPLAERALRPYRWLSLKMEEEGHGHISRYISPKASALDVVGYWTNARIHTPRDVPANLSYAKMAEVACYVRDVVLSFDGRFR